MHNHPNLERLVDKCHADQNRKDSDVPNKLWVEYLQGPAGNMCYENRFIGLIDTYDRGVLNNWQYLQNIARIATINTD